MYHYENYKYFNYLSLKIHLKYILTENHLFFVWFFLLKTCEITYYLLYLTIKMII